MYTSIAENPELLELVISWTWDWSTTPDASHDEFEVTVESGGVALYDARKTLEEYEVTQPNGPSCEPTCHNAYVDD